MLVDRVGFQDFMNLFFSLEKNESLLADDFFYKRLKQQMNDFINLPSNAEMKNRFRNARILSKKFSYVTKTLFLMLEMSKFYGKLNVLLKSVQNSC